MRTAEAAMSQSSLTNKHKKMRKSPPESSDDPKSFSSLPYDLVLNCLSRVSRTHDPILSLVSKSFRSLVSSPDLEAARFRILNTESCLYVCLKLNSDPNPSWFILSQTPKLKLIPLPSFPYQHPNCSTVVSTGSDVYMLGGFDSKGKESRTAYVLDCKSHQWRRLPEMLIARKEAAATVVDGKIYVYGGCSSDYYKTENWGEIYDIKTQTWELFPAGEVDLYSTTGVVPCNIRIDGVLYEDCGLLISGIVYDYTCDNRLDLCPNVCMVEIGCEDFQATVCNGKLQLLCCEDSRPWSTEVKGLEGMSSNYLLSVANHGGGNIVTVWWKTYTKECKTEIWCAQISFEIRVMEQVVWGVVEWSENVFTFRGSESDSEYLLLHHALVTLGLH